MTKFTIHILAASIALLLITNLSYGNNSKNHMPKFVSSATVGDTWESNPSLKTTVSKWLASDSCGDGKNQDYIQMFKLLSTEYIGKHFPGIKSASEYEQEMLNSSEIYLKNYLKVYQPVFIHDDLAKIKLIFESGNEGVIEVMEEEIFFKKEQGSWKYNGLDSKSLKVIKN